MSRSQLNILGLTYWELSRWLRHRCGKGDFHASRIYREVFRHGNPAFYKAESLPTSGEISNFLRDHLRVYSGPVTKTLEEDGLIKFVTTLDDRFDIESVIIPMGNYSTVCISSQVGCRMGCAFCETGSHGFSRDLSVDEIVGQVYTARFHFGYDIRNVVFMGMGEPLNNIENVIRSIRILTEQKGLNLAKRHITVSTVGIIEGIRRLADLKWGDLHLAVSLNAPNDEIRSRIMPISRSAPMAQLQSALLDYPLNRNAKILIEYVLIKDLNDSKESARQLARFLKPLKTKVNLIPVNPNTEARFRPPSPAGMDSFYDWLREEGLFVRHRTARGAGLMAACGQLGGRRR